jgi:ArsR family transcriptional regulator
MSMDRSGKTLVKVAKALGDPTRLELLRRISSAGEMCCKDLVALFPVSQATVSHHLKILVDAGLLEVRRDGQFGWYSLRPATVEAHATLLGKTLQGGRGRTGAGVRGGARARRTSR